MVAWRRMLAWLRVTAALVSGTALWLASGALALSGSNPAAERIGVLPGAGWWLACVGAIGACAHLAPARIVWLLLGGGLAWLPWLPGRVPPVFFVWVGPMLGLAVTVGAMVALGTDGRRCPTWLALWTTNPRRAQIAACVAAALLYTVGPLQLDDYTPGGDEPHYLVMTQSLLRDADLRIENNHRNGDYREYIDQELRPDYLNRGIDGEIYSVHAPGISALLAPAYALAGYGGVTAFLILLSALGAGLAWRLAFRLSGSPGAAWFGWAATACSVPFVLHAFTVYPDGPAAVIVLVGMWGLLEGDHATARSRVLQGTALSMLPWLHTRYAVLAASIGAAILLRERHRGDGPRRVAAFAAVPVLSAAAWFMFFRIIYGTFSPAAPYGGVGGTDSSLENLWRGLPALLFDQQFGLLANAPALTCGVLGLLTMVRREPSARRLAIEYVAICLPYASLSSSYQMWWGGYSAPARFLAPLVLALALPAAAFWAWARDHATHVFGLAALGVTLFITGALLAVGDGRLVYNNRDGVALWLEWVSPLADLNAALPAFHRHAPDVAVRHVAIWIAAVGLAWAVARIVCRPSHVGAPLPSGASAIALGLLALGVSAAIVGVWTQTGSRGALVTSSQSWVLRTTATRADLTSVRYPSDGGAGMPRVGAIEEGLRHLRLTSNVRRMPVPAPLLLIRQLPAGRYRVHVPFRSGAAGELRVSVGRTSQLIDTWPIPQGPNQRELQMDVTFPVPIHSLTVAADEHAKDAAKDAWVEPLSVRPSSMNVSNQQAVRAIRYGHFVAYFFSDDAFMEPGGFWLRPETTTAVVAYGEKRDEPARLFLRNGPVANTVALVLDDWSETVTLQPGEEREVQTTVAVRGDALSLRARATGAFRPSEVDPTSTDVRRLSCWVEFR